MRNERRIYLDHAATTPVHPEVKAAMEPFFSHRFGNAASTHGFGREAKVALDDARGKVARLIGAEIDEIVFTSGGTEADNFVLIGAALRHRERGRHIVTTQIEHHAVLHPCKFLESQGFEVTYIPVDSHCLVDPDDVGRAIRDDTILVSVILANNEVGTLQPVSEISRVVRERGVLFHTDAVQAVGSIPVNINGLDVDLLSLSAHKFYGPKGAGALYIKRGARLVPWLYGGDQERGRRSGTENIPAIVGLGAACELAQREMLEAGERVRALRNRLESAILNSVSDAQVNGSVEQRLPGHSNICFRGAPGESLLMNLDLSGIAVSTGSACASGALEASHVLIAMGLNPEDAKSSVRFTLGRGTTPEEVDEVAQAIPELIDRLRRIQMK